MRRAAEAKARDKARREAAAAQRKAAKGGGKGAKGEGVQGKRGGRGRRGGRSDGRLAGAKGRGSAGAKGRGSAGQGLEAKPPQPQPQPQRRRRRRRQARGPAKDPPPTFAAVAAVAEKAAEVRANATRARIAELEAELAVLKKQGGAGAGRRLAAKGKAGGAAKGKAGGAAKGKAGGAAKGRAGGAREGKAGGARAGKGSGRAKAERFLASGEAPGDDLSMAGFAQAVRHVITRLQALPADKLGLLGEPTPQHFNAPSGTGLWGDITDQSPGCPKECAPLSGGWEDTPDARAAIVRAAGAALGFPEARLVPVAHVLRPLHALHLHAKQNCRVDCTHYCYHPRVWEGVLDAVFRPIANWARLL